MEPLQDGPGPNIGYIKDAGLRTLLRRHAANPAEPIGSLIIITTRAPISDLAQWIGRSVNQTSLDRLEPAAGEELLRDNGVVGTSESLREAVRDFHGHPLALRLLAGFLAELHAGNVDRRDQVRSLLQDRDAIGHDHANRVMEAYRREWLDRQPTLLAVLHLVSLFDRPAGRDCLDALRLEPAISGLTDIWSGLDENSWNRAIDRLRKVGLLVPEDKTAPGSLDTHPLVREWFATDLRSSNPVAYSRAHARLYEHLQSTALTVANPSFEQLAPFYQAISHGAQAGLYQNALEEVYKHQICKRDAAGNLQNYSFRQLGAVSSNLSVLSWFFERPYDVVVPTLSSSDQTWVLSEAAIALATQGRFQEAIPPLYKTVNILESEGDLVRAADVAVQLSEAQTYAGRIKDALNSSMRALELADDSCQLANRIIARTHRAIVCRWAGQEDDGSALFSEAQNLSRTIQPQHAAVEPFLHWVHFYLCRLSIDKGQWSEARERSISWLDWARDRRILVDEAVATQMLGRANLGFAWEHCGKGARAAEVLAAAREAEQLLGQAVERIRTASYIYSLPFALIAIANYYRAVGDWDLAVSALDEADEISVSRLMPLASCDIALSRAALALARNEDFAPLASTRSSAPGRTSARSAQRSDDLVAAWTCLTRASQIITETGYYIRESYLKDLQRVASDECRFEELTPRV
jgi:tetratricopeptide (TPR) repeat protein